MHAPTSPAQEDVLDVAMVCCSSGQAGTGGAPARRLARTLQALLGLSTQLQDAMGVQRGHKHLARVAGMLEMLARPPTPQQ